MADQQGEDTQIQFKSDQRTNANSNQYQSNTNSYQGVNQVDETPKKQPDSVAQDDLKPQKRNSKKSKKKLPDEVLGKNEYDPDGLHSDQSDDDGAKTANYKSNNSQNLRVDDYNTAVSNKLKEYNTAQLEMTKIAGKEGPGATFDDVLASCTNLEEQKSRQEQIDKKMREKEKLDQGLGSKKIDDKFYLVSNPCCRRFLFLIKLLGAFAMMADLICDITYAFCQEFSSTSYFFSYIGLLAIRILLYPWLLSVLYLKSRVIKVKPTSYLYDIDQEKRAQLQKIFVRQGFTLHGFALPSFASLGLYRILPVRNFTSEVGLGYASDFVYIFAAFMLQALNNSTLQTAGVKDYLYGDGANGNSTVGGGLNQTYRADDLITDKQLATDELSLVCILLKVIVLGDILFEMFGFIYEVWRLHNLERTAVDLIVRFSEEKKREIFACRYLTISMIFISLVCASTYALTLVVPARECLSHQALHNLAVCVDCQQKYCSSCSSSGPFGCDECQLGYYWDADDQRCSDCDKYKSLDTCSKCTGFNQCSECNRGFRLGEKGTDQQGQCLSCDDSSCADCHEQAGACEKCLPGFYLEGIRCKPCTGHCKECQSATKCLKCDERVSTLNFQTNQCECLESKQWYPDPALSTDPSETICGCRGQFVTSTKHCLNCNQLFPGCSSCEDTDEYSSKNFFLGAGQVDISKPDQKEFAKCVQCPSGQHFDTLTRQCTSCGLKIPGCKRCSLDGLSCDECMPRHYLTRVQNGSRTCISCQVYDGACTECNDADCEKCLPGMINIGQNCMKKFW